MSMGKAAVAGAVTTTALMAAPFVLTGVGLLTMAGLMFHPWITAFMYCTGLIYINGVYDAYFNPWITRRVK